MILIGLDTVTIPWFGNLSVVASTTLQIRKYGYCLISRPLWTVSLMIWTYMCLGRRLDLILRKKELELGGGEAGKETEDNNAKLLSERDLKLPKALKDMMMIIKKEKGDLEDVRVAGLLTICIILDVPEKYAFRITRTQNVHVPYTFKDLPNFRKVLYMALSNKAIVVDTLNVSSNSVQNENEIDDDLCAVMIPP
ncbi:hypothetical protein INT45_002954 [Circinella minor]|uniref:Uncharacterized protein n=1 Tax=Circinella minor TaxID=1195481 RepID=A0A8H7S978_9FUNG|nr:hypothetical protein INT45_002954 [Circinella minor]